MNLLPAIQNLAEEGVGELRVMRSVEGSKVAVVSKALLEVPGCGTLECYWKRLQGFLPVYKSNLVFINFYALTML